MKQVFLLALAGAGSIFAAGFSADFSRSEISTSGACAVSRNYAAYNSSYGSSWVLYRPGESSIQVDFDIPSNVLVGGASVTITHLTSYSQDARGNGYAPVTLAMNGQRFATEYDVAEHHDGSHGFETDRWGNLSVAQGRNTLSISYCGDAETHYWIQSIRIEVTERPPSGVIGPASGSSSVRLLPCELVAASAIDNYNFIEPFIWSFNVGAKRDITYNPETGKLHFALEGIQGKYSDRTEVTVLFQGLGVRSLALRNGGDGFRTLPGTYVNVSENPSDVLMAPAFYASIVNWDSDLVFAATLPEQPQGEFSITIYAQNPSLSARLVGDFGNLVFSPVITMVKLLGYYDTYAVSSATYQCTFESSLSAAGRQRTTRQVWFILKSLFSSYLRLKP